ncbi:MAG: hypothetical protein WCH21_06960 [Bacteroidota bacterium]
MGINLDKVDRYNIFGTYLSIPNERRGCVNIIKVERGFNCWVSIPAGQNCEDKNKGKHFYHLINVYLPINSEGLKNKIREVFLMAGYEKND